MKDTIKQCRVCGKDYEPCRTAKYVDGVFHWREVSCSPECGAIYLQRVIESRTPIPAKAKKRHKVLADVEAYADTAE